MVAPNLSPWVESCVRLLQVGLRQALAREVEIVSRQMRTGNWTQQPRPSPLAAK